MNQSDWIALAAVVFSIVSFGFSFFLTARTSRASIRPVIALVYDNNIGWSIRNIGNGPALNVVVAQKPIKSNWFRPVRVPPVSAGGEFILQWIGHDNDHGIGVYYEDFHEKAYSSTCGNDLTKMHKGNIFPAWRDSQIGRHWWDNPVSPTGGGEVRGKWEGE